MNPSTAPIHRKLPETPVYRLISPDGSFVPVPVEFFALMNDWRNAKKAGVITLELNGGGIAGIKSEQRIK